jgi:hypothetical protein
MFVLTPKKLLLRPYYTRQNELIRLYSITCCGPTPISLIYKNQRAGLAIAYVIHIIYIKTLGGEDDSKKKKSKYQWLRDEAQGFY